MDTINVPYNDLFNAARELREQANVIRIEIQRLDETISNINWISKRARGFFTGWNNKRPQMDNWAIRLESFAAELETQARNMRDFDNQ